MDHPAQQYYNPHLTAVEERTLLRRNYLLLQTGQAALGLIGPGMLGMAVEARSDVVVIHFSIATRTSELEEDIDDIVFELEAFLGGGPEQHSQIASQVHVGQPDGTWPGRSHALLYLAKSPTG
ncbi:MULTISPECIES: hypothetical protein [unclassified Streptomyces]|uniref:hypothetical protein n=1 Tax=unclassified Streptomyces TaxID=2593676 RepID=UPI002E817F6A|nr:hypothetical protein [Streptomyces sp. NBC_00589]WTI33710.1 hypothetical protein OIC96_01210 [Streptomyces sp. NBC_00775]WUB32618.1 hypothetical protein OHA51_48525 [Streptomyces sp. NBC_00589]